MSEILPAAAALQRLQEGNRRFVEGTGGDARHSGPPDKASASQPQKPFAIILGCSDSRVPAEIVFDQGLGDLFVIRVAGNVVAPSQVDSVEFAASQFGTRLAVVLGHSQCGAILATIDEVRRDESQRSPNLRSIVDRVRPAVEPLVRAQQGMAEDELVQQAVRANVRTSVAQVKSGSRGIEALVRSGGLQVVGAEYCLESGVVTFLEDR